MRPRLLDVASQGEGHMLAEMGRCAYWSEPPRMVAGSTSVAAPDARAISTKSRPSQRPSLASWSKPARELLRRSMRMRGPYAPRVPRVLAPRGRHNLMQRTSLMTIPNNRSLAEGDPVGTGRAKKWAAPRCHRNLASLETPTAEDRRTSARTLSPLSEPP